jgi:hypothetical protein
MLGIWQTLRSSRRHKPIWAVLCQSPCRIGTTWVSKGQHLLRKKPRVTWWLTNEIYFLSQRVLWRKVARSVVPFSIQWWIGPTWVSTKQVHRLTQILARDASNTILRFLDLFAAVLYSGYLQRLRTFPRLISVAKYRLKLGRWLGWVSSEWFPASKLTLF